MTQISQSKSHFHHVFGCDCRTYHVIYLAKAMRAHGLSLVLMCHVALCQHLDSCQGSRPFCRHAVRPRTRLFHAGHQILQIIGSHIPGMIRWLQLVVALQACKESGELQITQSRAYMPWARASCSMAEARHTSLPFCPPGEVVLPRMLVFRSSSHHSCRCCCWCLL